MGLLADIYVSTDAEAVNYDTKPDQFEQRAQYKGFTPLELSILWSIMRGIEWDVASMDEFPCLLERDGGERLIHRLPAQMVAELSRLTPEQIAAVSPQWAAIEELGWPPDEGQMVVEDLVRLARQAVESSRGVYLWNCV
jgi:hypothetical protein